MFGARSMTHESAALTLTFWTETEASVIGLLSNDKRKGHATKLMQKLINFCDDKGITLRLQAAAFDIEEGGMDDDQLRVFYEKFGFILDEEDDTSWTMMVRNPKQDL